MSAKTKLPVMRKKKVKRAGNNKLIALLFLFFIIIFLVLFFNSSFSRIDTIHIQGLNYVTEDEIGQALGIQIEDQFFAVGAAALEERIKQIEIIESVEVTKVFPGQIHVDISEYKEVAYHITTNGSQTAILANGSEVEIDGQEIYYDKLILTGWDTNDPIRKMLSETLAEIPQFLMDDISEIKPYASISYPDKIKLYTRSYFEVVTTVEYLPDKISYLDEIIDDLKKNDIHSGVITMLLADTHAPFEEWEGNDKVNDME